MASQPFRPAAKLYIVHQLISGEKSLSQLSCEYKVAQTTIRNWRAAYQAKGEAAFFASNPQSRSVEMLEARVAKLEQFCRQLAMENAGRKKAFH